MNILGISCYYHDAAAVSAAGRPAHCRRRRGAFSRIKHDFGFPEQRHQFLPGERAALRGPEISITSSSSRSRSANSIAS